MSDDRPSEVLGALPHTRPHRRSQKRGAPTPPASAAGGGEANGADAVATQPSEAPPAKPVKAAPSRRSPAASQRNAAPAAKARARRPPPSRAKAERLPQPAQPGGTPPHPRSRKPVPATGADILGTAVQAVAELAEIGLSMSARAMRNALSRLPHP